MKILLDEEMRNEEGRMGESAQTKLQEKKRGRVTRIVDALEGELE